MSVAAHGQPSASASSGRAVDASLHASTWSVGAWRWEPVLAVGVILAAVAAVWVTLRANFLAHPGWLAVQKVDFILGPIGVGLYWRHRRPNNRLGLLLIALGLLGIPYIGGSTSAPWPFTLGVFSEAVIEPLTVAVILAFPSGRLEGLAERLVLAVMLLGMTLPYVFWLFTSSQYTPFFSISGCRAQCPANPLYVATPSWMDVSVYYWRSLLTFAYLATTGLLVRRFVTGTRPRRRALAIGAPIAMCYLLISATYQLQQLIDPGLNVANARLLTSFVQWMVAASRSLIWYGFLLALIAAELFAARVLRDVVRRSLGRPSLPDLEGMLRGPLGDPGLQLGFWSPGSRSWAGGDGTALESPGPGQRVTEVDRDGLHAAAIVHDAQLSEDPELLQAAGAAVLLAQENAELEAAWQASLHELSDSRARLVQAGDRERRKLERDLHDGAQQRLMSVQVGLRLVQEEVSDPSLSRRLEAIGVDATEAVEELRTLSHGIYPPVLRSGGLVRALGSLAMRATVPVTVIDEGIGRCSPPVDAAIYFCSAEAVQNAIKHAGSHVHVAITVGRDRERVRFAISDDGEGIDPSAPGDGDGLIGMRDRVGAVGGELHVVSSPGNGTTVCGTIPDPGAEVETEHSEGGL